mmetsp:Transcript_15912/g.42829  ORF Transcript_15912/g.42829 Transcript_15912/m.42829 type:complete len:533 (+) Transcript_15912:71-1669(+)
MNGVLPGSPSLVGCLVAILITPILAVLLITAHSSRDASPGSTTTASRGAGGVAAQMRTAAGRTPPGEPRCPFADGGGCAAFERDLHWAPDAVSFFAMADWGGSPDASAGYATTAERGVARHMGWASQELGGHFALALGDNFYDDGVADAHDPRLAATFERVFTHPALAHAPDFFRVVAGNHDYHGNVTGEQAYTRRRANWFFPMDYYAFEERAPGGGPSVLVVMLDTTALVGCSAEDRDDKTGQIESELCPQPAPASAAAGGRGQGGSGRGAARGSAGGSGGRRVRGDARYAGPWDPVGAEAQWQWLEETLQQATQRHVPPRPDYIVVAGHHPVFSTCWHGPTPELERRLAPLLEEYGVAAYLAGHDHCAQHIESNGVSYHLVGAAHESDGGGRPHRNALGPESTVQWDMATVTTESDVGAFAVLQASADGLLVAHVSSVGELMYTAARIPRRASAVTRVASATAPAVRATPMQGTARDSGSADSAPGVMRHMVAPRAVGADWHSHPTPFHAPAPSRANALSGFAASARATS